MRMLPIPSVVDLVGACSLVSRSGSLARPNAPTRRKKLPTMISSDTTPSTIGVIASLDHVAAQDELAERHGRHETDHREQQRRLERKRRAPADPEQDDE